MNREPFPLAESWDDEGGFVMDNRAASSKVQAVTAVAALAASIVLAATSFFNWSGVEYSSTGDRRIAFVAAIVSSALAVVSLTTGRSVLGWNLLPGFFALQMTNGAAVEIRDHTFEYAAYPAAEVQAALEVAIASAGVILATGAIGLVLFIVRAVSKRRPASTET
jgi:hypothetical protein